MLTLLDPWYKLFKVCPLMLHTPSINRNTTHGYIKKYFSDDHFFYIVCVITWTFRIGQNSRAVCKNTVAIEIEMHSRVRGGKHLVALHADRLARLTHRASHEQEA